MVGIVFVWKHWSKISSVIPPVTYVLVRGETVTKPRHSHISVLTGSR